MGDIATHAQVEGVVNGILAREMPDEPLELMEIGNWLTDVSQFNDPPAMVGAKLTIWAEAQERARADPAAAGLPRFVVDWYLSSSTNVPGFTDAMFGTPATGGALPRFLRELMYAAGCQRFGARNITAQEFDFVFQRCYTQYLPHEHLDFPPWPRDAVLGDRQRSRWACHRCDGPPLERDMDRQGDAAAPTRRMLRYLDTQIAYIAALLTDIEAEWKRLVAQVTVDRARARQERLLLLARFGHALHAVEDFFFHSNFVEIAWSRRGPTLDPLPGGRGNLLRSSRLFLRRTRAPKSVDASLSTTESWAAGSIYTGFFGPKDIYHTLADAADILAEGRDTYPGPLRMLLGNLGAEERRTLRDEPARRDRLIDTYRAGTWSADYQRAVDRARGQGWHDLAIRAMNRAVEIDRDLHERFSGGDVPREMCGVFEFLLLLLGRADEEHERSEAQSRHFDTLGGRTTRSMEGTDNGASAETIGSHSLLAKDSPHKEPLRQPAINLAAHVAAFVARTMAAQVRGGAGVPGRRTHGAGAEGTTVAIPGPIDWLHLLQHFLCHPDEAEGQWHLAPLLAADEQAAVGAPYHYTPRALDHPVWRVEARLRDRYNALASEAQRAWEAR